MSRVVKIVDEYHALSSPSRSNVVPLPRQAQRGDQSLTRAARRKRKERAHHRNGEHHYGMWLPDRCVEGLILKCITEGRLTPEQAMRPKLVSEAIRQLLIEDGFRWLP
jgi:hypothetical protein